MKRAEISHKVMKSWNWDLLSWLVSISLCNFGRHYSDFGMDSPASHISLSDSVFYMQCEVGGSSFILLLVAILLFQHQFRKDQSFTTELSWHNCRNWSLCKCKGLFLDFEFDSIDVHYIPSLRLVLVLHCLDYCSFVVSFEIKRHSFLRLFWFLYFYMNFRINLSMSSKEPAGILLGLHWVWRPIWESIAFLILFLFFIFIFSLFRVFPF